MAFFEKNPLGRLLNRFQNDQQQIDWQLCGLMTAVFATLFQTIAQAGLVCFNSAWLLAAFVPIAIVFYSIARYFRNSSRELQRLASVSNTPIYSSFTEALTGATTIQASGSQSRFLAAHLKRVNYNMRAVWHQRVAAVRLAVAADEASGGGDSEVWWRRECWRRRRRMRNHACAAVGVRAPRAALGRRAWSAPISISTPSRADLGLR